MYFPRESICRFLARHRRHWLINKIGMNLGYYHRGFQNLSYDTQNNGERFALEQLAAVKAAPVIFDVGAHYGEWAGMAAQAAPRATVHSFEVIPATFAKLAQQISPLSTVTPHHLGLSDIDGTLEFSVARDNDALSSAQPGVHGEFHKFDFYKVSCPVMRGDRFCSDHGIGFIDFLKLDVEALEPKVLAGFSRMLAENRIGAVQFEYGQINLKARFFLEDYYRLLEGYGMNIGKIYPSYVDFQPYHFTQDDLQGPNYLAVPSTNTAYLQALAGG